jgi:predicted nicotinamide N-methyase
VPVASAEHLIAVLAATTLSPTPLLPEIDLYVAEDTYSVWEMTTRSVTADTAGEPPVPFWSFPWPGGQALARYLLDHPDLVAGRRVLDLASGSGLVGIAAAKAGAAIVTTIDIDPFAAAAQTMNARANEVQLDVVLADVLDDEAPDFDVVLAGDVCYERELTARMMGYLRRAHDNGAIALLGDPGRTYLPRAGLTEMAAYDVPTTLALESATTKRTAVWRLS